MHVEEEYEIFIFLCSSRLSHPRILHTLQDADGVAMDQQGKYDW